MKVNCIKITVDFERIYSEIDRFRLSHNGENPSYIIMNDDTKAELMKRYDFRPLKDKARIAMIYGIPIVIYTGLEFGEVDII